MHVNQISGKGKKMAAFAEHKTGRKEPPVYRTSGCRDFSAGIYLPGFPGITPGNSQDTFIAFQEDNMIEETPREQRGMHSRGFKFVNSVLLDARTSHFFKN